MLKPKARWQVSNQNQDKAEQIARELDVSPLLGQLLLNRGFDSLDKAEAFLYMKQDFYDPFLLDGMSVAVERIQKAIQNQEKILVFGDYDADGVSSTSLLVSVLKMLGADSSYYVPNRFTEGYGPNIPALEKAHHNGVSLVITVDTGIAAHEAAEAAKYMGLDYIVTDHHEPPPTLPDAYCIINPKKPGCPYPFKSLAGVGVAFKLAHALLGRVPSECLDIAVLGTVADLVPLVDENRLIVAKGLEEINRTIRPGIQALIEVSGLSSEVINSDHIGFALGPRLNAAGRMDAADPAIELILATSKDTALELASDLNQLNEERKAIVDRLTEEASIIAEQLHNQGRHVFVISGEDWHAGVIGIVASRIVEKYYRPTIVLSIDRETGLAKGSARSIDGFDIYKALSTCRDLLPHFGGHPMAAGMTLSETHLESLAERLNGYADNVMTPDMLKPLIKVECICSLEDISVEMITSLNQLAPYGVANPKPKFLLNDATLAEMKQIGAYKNHLKLTLKEKSSQLDVVGFHFGDLYHDISPSVRLATVGELSVNEWNGFRKPQLMLEDLAVNEWQLYDFRGKQNILETITRLPVAKRRLLSFQQKTVQDLNLHQMKEEIVYFADGVPNEEQGVYLVLLDLPDSIDAITQVFNYYRNPERVYAVFHTQEVHYFSSIPSRDQFKWLYGILTKLDRVPLEKVVEKVNQYRGWSKNTISFMINVFFELGFVKINNGLIQLEKQPAKKPLTDSTLYRTKEANIELESMLCYSSYSDLKAWIAQFYETGTKIEEAFVK